MTDHLDRAAEALWASVDDKGIRGRLFREDCDYLARALDEAGLLVTPERDEERAVGSPAVAEPPVSREDVEAVLKLAYKGTSDMDREPNWLGRVRRWARDGAPFPTVESTPEPATPEHDAAVAAKAWDEGFKQGGPMHDVNYDDPDAHTRNPYEREAGESDGGT